MEEISPEAYRTMYILLMEQYAQIEHSLRQLGESRSKLIETMLTLRQKYKEKFNKDIRTGLDA